MIKKLSIKFVLVSLVLAVVVFTVSSCYALTVSDYPEAISKDNIREMILNNSKYSSYADGKYFCYKEYSNGYWYIRVFEDALESFTLNGTNLHVFAKSGYSKLNHINFHYNPSNSTFTTTFSEGNTTTGFSAALNFSVKNILGYSDVYIYDYSGNVIYEPNTAIVEVTHQFQSDTSAKVSFDYSSYGTDYILKYSLTGVELNTDLTSPLQLKNPVTYTPRSK